MRSWQQLRQRDLQYRASVSISPHPEPLTRSPFPYEGKALTPPKRSMSLLIGRGIPQLAASEALPLPDRGRVLAFTSAGGAKPNAGRGGLEGFTPPHH